MADIHIDDFYRDSAKILVALYGHFPRKMTLYVEDISGPDTPDDFGLHSTRHQACFETMMWLAGSDYIEYEQAVYQEALDQAVLSHRGFLTLNSVQEPAAGIDQSLSEAMIREESLAIHQIQYQLKHGTSFSLAEQMRSLLRRSRSLGDMPRIIG